MITERPDELRRINWTECFPFTSLFRTFKMAIQPGKLGLAVAAVILTALWGWFLDGIWSSKHQPLASEIEAYCQTAHVRDWRETEQKKNIDLIRTHYLRLHNKLPETFKMDIEEKPGKVVSELLGAIKEKYQAEIASRKAQQAQDKNLTNEQKAEEITNTALRFRNDYTLIKGTAPQGIFKSFIAFEVDVARQCIAAACQLKFIEGLPEVLAARAQTRNIKDLAQLGATGRGRGSKLMAFPEGPEGLGVLACKILALRGFQWMWQEHTWFFILFGLPALLIWSLFGGAICRIATLQFARDERISMQSALSFARLKLPGLFAAPLFPLMMIVGIGIFHIVGGLLATIPIVGEILGGLAGGLAIIGGLLMAAVLIGGLAGGSLMWPTIATEGSDSFDAMSRSYSYIYSRPWRAMFYAAILTIYGAVCFVFVRSFALIALKTARLFIGMGMHWSDRPATGLVGATKIDVIWPNPTFIDLAPASPVLGAEYAEPIMGWLLGLWILLAVAMVYAFVASFFFSGATIIYFLLRREVDATDIEDIYLEGDELENDFTVPVSEGGDMSGPVATSGSTDQGQAPSSMPPTPAGEPPDAS